MRSLTLLIVAVMGAGTLPASAGAAQLKDHPHPFIAWTSQEAAAARQRIQSQDWARREYDAMMAEPRGQTFARLFAWSAMGDAKAAEQEKKYLLSFIDAPVDEKRRWADNYLSVLRYDVLYDQLTAQERQGIERTFRTHIEWQLTRDTHNYTKLSWLPNMMWPRPFSTYMMALVLKDEDLIRKCFNDRCGWKWYFDQYISDGYFYQEEFAKQPPMNGQMLLWAMGLDRLGLGEMGFDYVGQGGATLRKYLESYFLLAYPKIYLGDDPASPTARPMIPMLAMGDAKGGGSALGRGYFAQHNVVDGRAPGEKDASQARWRGANMNGRDHRDAIVQKLNHPLWFEILHRKYPDGHFDWLLCQMRAAGQDKYYPSLLFGLEPIDPAKVRPPRMPSGVYPQRGLALLRSDESENYFDSPGLALFLRSATPYAHSVPDSLAIAGLYAFNRAIYLNRGAAGGYAGVDPGWSNSMRSHGGVLVDGREPGFSWDCTSRSKFTPEAKMAAFGTRHLYPDLEAQRLVVLTGQYVLDVFALHSPYARNYQWQVHTLGHAAPDNPDQWAESRQLVGSSYDLVEERSCVVGEKPWTVYAIQRTAGAEPEAGILGPRWWQQRVGVRMTMLGEEGTIAYTALNPTHPPKKDRLSFGAIERGGLSILAARNKKQTAFIALHEPFMEVQKIAAVQVLQRQDQGATLAVDHVDGTRDTIRLNWATDAKDDAFAFQRAAGAATRPTAPVGVVAGAWNVDTLRLSAGGSAKAQLWLRNQSTAALTALKLTAQASAGLRVTPSELSLDLKSGQEQTVELTLTAEGTDWSMQSLRLVASDAAVNVQAPRLAVTVGVVNQPLQIWPADFARTLYAPRYVARYYYYQTVAAEFLLDPSGQRRFDGQKFPRLMIHAPDAPEKDRWPEHPLSGFQAFDPRPRKEADGTPFLSDTGTHPHGYSSPCEYRFTQDWIWIRYKGGAGKEICFDWSGKGGRDVPSLAEKFPPRTLLFDRAGKALDLPDKPQAIEVAALWRRPVGLAHGELTLYPAGSRLAGAGDRKSSPRVAQPGDQPMAFTFASEEEVGALVAKWLNLPAPVVVPPWGQGERGN